MLSESGECRPNVQYMAQSHDPALSITFIEKKRFRPDPASRECVCVLKPKKRVWFHRRGGSNIKAL